MNRICRKCKASTMQEVESAQNLTVKGIELRVEGLRHLECKECHAQVETPAQIDFNAEKIRSAWSHNRSEFKRSQGLLTGKQIRELRSQFGITQKQAAKIFGGGPTAFAKYEAEDVVQSAAMDKLLRVALAVPEAAKWLAAEAGESVAVNQVRVAFANSIQLNPPSKISPRDYASIFKPDASASLGKFSLVGEVSSNDMEYQDAA